MSAITDYQRFDHAFKEAKKWGSLMGSPYSGGGGGVGKVCHTTFCKMEIYHQAYDGATNYHEAPGKEFCEELNEALRIKAHEIIKIAVERMEQKRVKLASAAKKEAEDIISSADGASKE